jgi:DNA-directed RNA polymerase specialized sigma24 family protein
MKPNINDRCSEQDYRNLFATSAQELRWLCYTLTGDDSLSERAMDAALEQSLKGANHIFREWMLSWARRLIIRFCVSSVRPATAARCQQRYAFAPEQFKPVSTEEVDKIRSLPADRLQQQLLELDALPRFVFALRAIEEYSRRDTALLLDIDDRTCEWAYSQAIQGLRPNVSALKSVRTAMELVAV